MKKSFSVALALLFSCNVFAQFGIVGGLTSSSSDIKTAVCEIKKINQFHVGVLYKIGIGNIIAIQPALEYNVKGTTLENFEGLGKIDFKTGFIELPVQVQAGIGVGKVFRIFAVAEPFIGYALSNQAVSGDTSLKSWDYVKSRLEYGLGLGGGLELFTHLQISVRYFWNFGDLYYNKIEFQEITHEISSSKCSGISFSVAVLF